MNFLCFGDKNNKSILFIHGMASTAMLCYEPILKRLSDYYVILAEVDGHSERKLESVSAPKRKSQGRTGRYGKAVPSSKKARYTKAICLPLKTHALRESLFYGR